MSLIRKGDKVALIAPSCAVAKDELRNGRAFLESQGFEVVEMPHLYARKRYMAGSPEERAQDVMACFADSSIRAVFCARGGAGSLQILPFLDYKTIRQNPKPVFGLSDSTALQNALYACAENVSYTGFLPIYDCKNQVPEAYVSASLEAVWSGREQVVCLNHKIKQPSFEAEGIAVGGCLSVFCSLFGTPYCPNLTDKILFLEDVGEKTYKIETFLTMLSLQKGFSALRGIVFGQFKNCVPADAQDGTIDEILDDFEAKVPFPVVRDFPYGHELRRVIVPIGAPVKIRTDADCVTVVIPA